MTINTLDGLKSVYDRRKSPKPATLLEYAKSLNKTELVKEIKASMRKECLEDNPAFNAYYEALRKISPQMGMPLDNLHTGEEKLSPSQIHEMVEATKRAEYVEKQKPPPEPCKTCGTLKNPNFIEDFIQKIKGWTGGFLQ